MKGMYGFAKKNHCAYAECPTRAKKCSQVSWVTDRAEYFETQGRLRQIKEGYRGVLTDEQGFFGAEDIYFIKEFLGQCKGGCLRRTIF
jgi:hypothetical protein